MPVIASNVGGIPEMVRDGLDGHLVVPGDPKLLSEAMNQVLTDRDEASALASNARDKVVQTLNTKLMAIRTGEMYHRTLECAQ